MSSLLSSFRDDIPIISVEVDRYSIFKRLIIHI